MFCFIFPWQLAVGEGVLKRPLGCCLWPLSPFSLPLLIPDLWWTLIHHAFLYRFHFKVIYVESWSLWPLRLAFLHSAEFPRILQVVALIQSFLCTPKDRFQDRPTTPRSRNAQVSYMKQLALHMGAWSLWKLHPSVWLCVYCHFYSNSHSWDILFPVNISLTVFLLFVSTEHNMFTRCLQPWQK